MLAKLYAWLSMNLGAELNPLPQLVECFARRGVDYAAWEVRDRSRHRVHAALYDDLLQ